LSVFPVRGLILQAIDCAQRQLIEQLAPITESELIPLETALGRFLAEDVYAEQDVPASDISLFDGYALSAPSAYGSSRQVAGVTYAGDAPAVLPEGDFVWRIFTGAPLPDGANAIIAQESVTSSDGQVVTLHESMSVGAGVRPKGADSRHGQRVLCAGTRLDAAELGLLASIGCAQILVVRKPRVAFFTTGNELVAPGEPLEPGKIYNSNHIILVSALTRLGVEMVDLGVLPDEASAIRTALLAAAKHVDLVLTSGGVSVGDADLVRQVVSEIGTIESWRVFLKPGKPLAFGRIGSVPFIGLPGNPVSTFVTFFLFVRPALRALAGGDPQIDRPPLNLPLAQDWVSGDRPEFIRVRRERAASGETRLQPFGDQNSGLLSSIAWADGVALIPADRTLMCGDMVDYFPFEGWYL
jgi:molybdopterin molybdotransferase